MSRPFLSNLVWGTLLLFLSVAVGSSQTKQNAIFSEGPVSLDHVMIVVRDLPAATADFRRMGFNANSSGRFDDGVENSVAFFENDSYLELLGVYDPVKAAETAEVKFLQKHEGILGYAIAVESVASTKANLESRGIKCGSLDTYPNSNQGGAATTWYWKIVKILDPRIPGGLFVIEYNKELIENYARANPERSKSLRVNANTAKGLSAVVIAVEDLDRTRKAYRLLDFEQESKVNVPNLESRGVVFKVGSGEILLVQAKNKNSSVAAFLKSRGEGVLGVQVKVADFATLRRQLPVDWHKSLINNNGTLLVPASLASGTFIEFVK